MEPRIQYAKTSDGVSIAYCEAGEGTPFIEALWLSNIELEFRDWEWHRIMAARRRLIRFDHRGCGLSQRDVPDLSVTAMAMDIEAVVDALGLQTVALESEVWGVPVAIAYAAAHPERVSHLVLFAGFANGAEFYEIPKVKTLINTLDQGDWELFTDTMGLVQVGWELADVARGLGESIRASQTIEQAQPYFRAARGYDVTKLLSQVNVPTLVLHPRGTPFPTLEMSQKLAAGIPGAQLKVLESSALWSNEMEPQYLAALDEFIGDGGRPKAAQVLAHVQRVAQKPASLATVLFTDVEGSTALTDRLGDAKARELLREHERVVREALKAHGGTEIKTMGDGFMASFGSATKALECAIAVQRAFEEWNAGVGAQHTGGQEPAGERTVDGSPDVAPIPVGAAPLRVRIGLNAGEPIAEDDPDGRGDLFGTAVIRAARIAALAQGGEIVAANVVRELAEGKGFMFGDRGEVALRGFDDPVRVFEVRWREDA